MARVLIAWEFGRNLGHIARDLPLARACRDAGHEVVWAVRDLRGAARELAGEGFALLQAPLLRSGQVNAPPINFADMLLREGAYNAINLDGGGSTTLAMEDPVSHHPRIVNFSSDNPNGRSVASSLAIFAPASAGQN